MGYFAKDFAMNYTLFALIAVMNFPGNLLNLLVVPYYNQFKVRYVIVAFELILAASCLIILPWHTVSGLLIARLLTGFAITAARSEVNATIGAFTFDFNDDNHINFREFTALAGCGTSAADCTDRLGLNCTDCVGQEYYNILVKDD